MHYLAPICCPQSSLFNGQLEFSQAAPPKPALVYVISSIGYPVLALLATVYWMYFSYDSYRKEAVLAYLEHKYEYVRQESAANLRVTIALRMQKVKVRLLSLAPLVHSIQRQLGLTISASPVSAQQLQKAYQQRRSILLQEDSSLSREDKLAELVTQMHMLSTYERLRRETACYHEFKDDIEALRAMVLKRIVFHQLRVKIALLTNTYLIEGAKRALVPFVGLSRLQNSADAIHSILESKGILQQYQKTILDFPWLKPY
jgi:hypothetical protein